MNQPTMKDLILITDYKNNFGSKWKAKPYRSGFDKSYLAQLFAQNGLNLIIIPAVKVNCSDNFWKDAKVIYTSSEEYGLHYKSYLEDIITALELKGATVIPKSIFLRAHENKVFMEQLRKVLIPSELQTIQAQTVGSMEELNQMLTEKNLLFPTVLKTASGAMSTGVFLAKTETELLKTVKKISSNFNLSKFIKEKIREKKHENYKLESQNQRKFILQPFIKNLTCDWKVLIYGNKLFVLRRNIREKDFRASGSGFNYKAGSESEFPEKYLDFVYQFYKHLDVPNVSLDFAFDGENPYIIEFQAIYFGTSTQFKSKDYYELIDNKWELKQNNFDQESIFVDSIIQFLNQ